jgi:hypothetical protein
MGPLAERKAFDAPIVCSGSRLESAILSLSSNREYVKRQAMKHGPPRNWPIGKRSENLTWSTARPGWSGGDIWAGLQTLCRSLFLIG